jgi:hypothetical protein
MRPGQRTLFEITDESYEAVWEKAVSAISWNCSIIKTDKKRGLITAELEDETTGCGNLIGVFIMPVRRVTAETEIKTILVEVTSEKKSMIRPCEKDRVNAIIAAMNTELGL